MSETLSRASLRAIENTDKLSPALRQCVHEYGHAIVHACLCIGIREPRLIHYIVHEIWNGARQPQQRRRFDGDARQHPCSVISHLDWLLIQSGSNVSAETLVRVLWRSGLVIVPLEPNAPMIEASMAEIANHDERVTKPEKHRRRLKVAIDAAARRLWPHLFREAKS